MNHHNDTENSHPFTTATLAVTARRLDNAIALLEAYADTCGAGVADPEALLSRGYAELLAMRGMLQSAAQLEYMFEQLARRDSPQLPLLRVVR